MNANVGGRAPRSGRSHGGLLGEIDSVFAASQSLNMGIIVSIERPGGRPAIQTCGTGLG